LTSKAKPKSLFFRQGLHYLPPVINYGFLWNIDPVKTAWFFTRKLNQPLRLLFRDKLAHYDDVIEQFEDVIDIPFYDGK